MLFRLNNCHLFSLFGALLLLEFLLHGQSNLVAYVLTEFSQNQTPLRIIYHSSKNIISQEMPNSSLCKRAMAMVI